MAQLEWKRKRKKAGQPLAGHLLCSLEICFLEFFRGVGCMVDIHECDDGDMAVHIILRDGRWRYHEKSRALDWGGGRGGNMACMYPLCRNENGDGIK